MNSAFAIDVSDLHKTYSEGLVFRKRFTALKGVSLRVPEGEIFGLLGPNGAGKTTLVKILLGIIRKTHGHATMLGMPAGSIRARKLVGYLPEHLRMASHLTPYTALECYGALAGLPLSHVKKHRDRLLEQVGLTDWKKERTKKFSKGMLQRLGLAQALLSHPRLLFLDEPTDGLDPRARAEMREIIQQLRGEGVTIFLNSHLLQEVEMICKQVAILDHGELKYCGPVHEAGKHAREANGLGSGWVVEFRIASESPVDLGLPESETPQTSSVENGLTVVRVQVEDQAQVDRIIDRIRSQRASLVNMNRIEASLEDAFLAMIDKP